MLDDCTFRRAIETELSVEPGLDSTSVSVSVRDGVATVTGHFVTLTGEVDWEFQRALIERTVRLQSDVIGVVNLIKIRRRSVVDVFQEQLMAAFRQITDVESCAATPVIDGHMPTLAQKVRTARARRKAMNAASAKPRAPKLIDQFAAG
jgi:osmotically-inducible protein OsmY